MTNPSTSSAIVQRLWNYCNVLRDDGMSYGDYVEQLTYLLFLKMDEEQLVMRPSSIPQDLRWSSLLARDGDDLETHYRHILTELGKGQGLIPTIFRKAQNKIQDPAKLRRLVELINGETWMGLDEEMIARDKANLDIFWLRDESLEDSADLPEPDVLAAEIVEDLRAALEQFEAIGDELQD